MSSKEYNELNLHDLNSSYDEEEESVHHQSIQSLQALQELQDEEDLLDMEELQSLDSTANDNPNNDSTGTIGSTGTNKNSVIKGSVPQRGYTVHISNEDLIAYIRNGIEPKRCKDLLVKYNMGMIIAEARRCNCFIPFEDLIQYGVMGFLNALETYDLKQGQFITYALTSVRQHIVRHANRDMRSVQLPEYISVENAKLVKYINTFKKQFNRIPTNEEIIAELKITGTRLNVLQNLVLPKYISTETPVHSSSDSQRSFGDALTGIGLSHSLDIYNLNSCTESTVNDVLNLLTSEDDRILVSMVHGLGNFEPYTLEEISNSEWAKSIPSSSCASLSRKYNKCIELMKLRAEHHGISFTFMDDLPENK